MLTNVLREMNCLQNELNTLCLIESTNKTSEASTDIFLSVVTDQTLRKKTEKLFRDGHHARAVEEAYKFLDNLVYETAEFPGIKSSGASLMQKVFSVDNPILKINAGETASEIDEQKGYLQILSGCMTGVRNPRAHDSDWEDTEGHAIELLALANHLIEKVKKSTRCSVK